MVLELYNITKNTLFKIRQNNSKNKISLFVNLFHYKLKNSFDNLC